MLLYPKEKKIFWCHSKTISLKFTFLLSKMLIKNGSENIHHHNSQFWLLMPVMIWFHFGSVYDIKCPFQKKVVTTGSSWSVHRKKTCTYAQTHTHTFLSTRLGATLHHRNSWGISALPRRQMKLVGIVVTEWPLWESYNVVLHPLCTAWGGKSCLEGWFTGLQGCCYPPPCPRHGGMLAKKEWLTDYKAKVGFGPYGHLMHMLIWYLYRWQTWCNQFLFWTNVVI